MPIRTNTNTSALNIQHLMQKSNKDLQTRLARLTSALRINQAADDAAGLSISERLRADIVGLQQGVSNAQHAINQTQVTEGGLNEVSGLLVRMRELSVQASSSTLNDNNRAAIQSEFSQLAAEVNRITQSTAPEQPSQTFQVGANPTQADQIETQTETLTTNALNIDSASVATAQSAQQSISSIDQAVSRVTAQRADIGALQNRLIFSIRSSENAIENAQASESTIRDADIAQEVTALTRSRILNQASTALLAQANIQAQNASALLG